MPVCATSIIRSIYLSSYLAIYLAICLCVSCVCRDGSCLTDNQLCREKMSSCVFMEVSMNSKLQFFKQRSLVKMLLFSNACFKKLISHQQCIQRYNSTEKWNINEPHYLKLMIMFVCFFQWALGFSSLNHKTFEFKFEMRTKTSTTCFSVVSDSWV